jgi:hypothetical protein
MHLIPSLSSQNEIGMKLRTDMKMLGFAPQPNIVVCPIKGTPRNKLFNFVGWAT